MSEETAQRLRDAERAEAQAKSYTAECEQKCLEAVAAGLAEKLEVRARSISRAEPDVTTSLGREGVTQLRTDLAATAGRLAEDLRGSRDRVPWPEADQPLRQIRSIDVEQSLRAFLKGPRLDAIAKVFVDHGYSAGSRGVSGQWLVIPQYVLDGVDFQEVASALTAQARASGATQRAQTAHSNDVVDGLWD